ncbi:proline/betaine transporter [Pycnococcus provasolii]
MTAIVTTPWTSPGVPHLQVGGVQYASAALALLRHVWPICIGNVLEWYEYSAYAYVTPEIKRAFFGGDATLTWLGFAVTFVARPLGGTVFGILSDRYGRRRALLLTIWGMLFATVAQGLLPTRSFVFAAAMCTLRIVQGACAGGEVGAISVFLAESAEPGCRGMAIALISMTGNLAFFAASGVVVLLRHTLDDDAMSSWGWRVPFLLALPPGLLSAFMRSRIQETKAFLREDGGGSHIVQNDVVEGDERELDGEHTALQPTGNAASATTTMTTASYPSLRDLAIAISAPAGIASVWYGVVYSASLNEDALLANAGAQLVALFLNPIAAMVSDAFGVERQQLVANILIMVLGPVGMHVATNREASARARFASVSVLLGSLQGFAGATIYLLVVQLFSVKTRNTRMGFTYNVSLAIFGGLFPVCAELIGPSKVWCLLLMTGLISVLGCCGALVIMPRKKAWQ